jgi:integrase
MPEKIETTHILLANELVVYRRERSSIWQCRFKVGGIWQRASAKERDLKKAQAAAPKLMITAEIRLHENLPVVTRKFRDFAKQAVQRMKIKLTNNDGKVSYNDYIKVIEDYLIPILGNRLITNIDGFALDDLDSKRIEKMGKVPAASTILTHNAALNLVFDEAVLRNFLTEVNRPKLKVSGRKSDRRPAFELNELHGVLDNLEAWIERAKNERSKETRQIMRDYIEMLVDTGARPGVELMNLKWRQIKFMMHPTEKRTGEFVSPTNDEEPVEIVQYDLNRTVEMTVSGKTGRRQIIGRQPTVRLLERVALRNYGIKNNIAEPLKNINLPTNNDFVLRTKDKKQDVSNSLQKMLERYLEDHNLLKDPKTGQNRVFYSFRHTYATLALTHDRVPIHTLAQQMGTSVLMIERHYSHLKVINAIEQLRGAETRKLMANTKTVDELYASKIRTKSQKNKS